MSVRRDDYSPEPVTAQEKRKKKKKEKEIYTNHRGLTQSAVPWHSRNTARRPLLRCGQQWVPVRGYLGPQTISSRSGQGSWLIEGRWDRCLCWVGFPISRKSFKLHFAEKTTWTFSVTANIAESNQLIVGAKFGFARLDQTTGKLSYIHDTQKLWGEDGGKAER